MNNVGWTQACCETCWRAYSVGRAQELSYVGQGDDGDLADGFIRHVSRIKPEFADRELCVFCGRETISGIYLRINPRLTMTADLGFYPTAKI